MSVIIYGFFELAEQIDSPVPVFLVYAAICLGFVFFPLRHFARTATIASLIWVIASIASIISRATGTHFRLVTAATALVIGITVFTLYAIAEAADTDAHVSRRRELQTLAIKVAIALIVATGCLATSLALRLESAILPGNEHGIANVMLILGLISLAIGVLVVSSSSLVLGVRHVTPEVRTIPLPTRPNPIMPPAQSPEERSNYAQSAPGNVTETFSRVIYQVLALMADVARVTARILVNSIVLAAYELLRALVISLNMILRLIVLTARWIRAAAVTAKQVSFYAISIAWRSVWFTVASVVVPVSALAGTPWLLMAAANETLRYLRQGPLVSLRDLFVLGLAATALLFISFIILANQSPRESLKSFTRSAAASVAYGLMILAAGCWLLGIPGSLGYGHIHIGLITISSSVLILVVAFLGKAPRRRAGIEAGTHPEGGSPAAGVAPSARPDSRPEYKAASDPPRSRHRGRGWGIAVMTIVLIGIITGIAIWAPWVNRSVLPPTGLATGALATTSASIHWSAPSSGQRPGQYIIVQNGATISSVPGTVISYHATGLIPDTSYTYQVIAVQGGRRSPRSSPVRAHTLAPPVSTAILVGSWTVHYTDLAWNGLNSAPNLTTDTWTFTPHCAAVAPAQCAATLAGTLNGSPFTATLDRSGFDYTGKGTNNGFMSCVSTPITGNLTFTIKALTAGVVGEQWAATSWSGTISIDIPATNCNAASVTATIHATH